MAGGTRARTSSSVCVWCVAQEQTFHRRLLEVSSDNKAKAFLSLPPPPSLSVSASVIRVELMPLALE